MYTLLSGLYKYMFQKDEYCILILGLDNAGKTVGRYVVHVTQ
jgi:ADP-ribosylation factor related protein 1